MSFDTIVAYTYRTEILCPTCTTAAVAEAQGVNLPMAGVGQESWLTFMSECLGIDRMDESAFDSGDFPKVIFPYGVTDGERCGGCLEEL